MAYLVSIVTDSTGYDININDLFVTTDKHFAISYMKRFNHLMRKQKKKCELYVNSDFNRNKPFMFDYIYYRNPWVEVKTIEERRS